MLCLHIYASYQCLIWVRYRLTLPAPCIPGISVEMKINLKFLFSHFFVVSQKVLRRPFRPFKLIFSFRLRSGLEGLKVLRKPLLFEKLGHGFYFYWWPKKIMYVGGTLQALKTFYFVYLSTSSGIWLRPTDLVKLRINNIHLN